MSWRVSVWDLIFGGACFAAGVFLSLFFQIVFVLLWGVLAGFWMGEWQGALILFLLFFGPGLIFLIPTLIRRLDRHGLERDRQLAGAEEVDRSSPLRVEGFSFLAGGCVGAALLFAGICPPFVLWGCS